jgi:hypothetical protein
MAIALSPKTKEAIIHLAAVINGQKGGLAKGRNKAKACRINGKLGGRPMKRTTATA